MFIQSEEVRTKKATALREWRAKNPNRVKAANRGNVRKLEHQREVRNMSNKKYCAQQLIKFAVKCGVLERGPCEICDTPNGQGHHDDYDKPMEVRWLCGTHHRQWHTENGPGANG